MKIQPKTRILLATLAVALLGCGDEVDGDPLSGTTETATLELLAPLPQPGTGQPACIAIAAPTPAEVPILLDVNNATLRPEGACGATPACGHLKLSVDGKDNAHSAAPVVMLQLHRLADPYHDGTPHAATGKPDLLDIQIELVNDAAESWLDEDDQAIGLQFDLAVVRDAQECP